MTSQFLMVEAGEPGENHRSLRVKLQDHKRVEKNVESAGIRTHAPSDRDLLAQCLTTKPRSSPVGPHNERE